MTREDLVAKIAKDAAITKKQADLALRSVLDGVTESLQAGDKMAFIGFGTFQVAERKERKGINPKTKAEIKIPATKAPVFKAGSKLKEAVK